ncbi:RICIN domain-containing protein [Kitasatospora sp. NPDC088264]|uniref:RICIN domain-containing protein n=1 Tax=Kitasatospora sp. NPDC088264 TaxID=3155296 RepID=UPI003419D06C
MGSAGRPQGQLKGETEQANALARFVREVTGGATVRELAQRYPASKTSWSEYRSAEKDIPWHLLERLVHDCAVDPQARTVLLVRARALHEQAGRAAAGTAPSHAEGRSAARQALERARQAQRQAEAGVAQAEDLIRVLVAIVAELRGELSAGTEDGAGPGGRVSDGGYAAQSRRSRLREATRCLAEVRRIREDACQVQRTAGWEEDTVGLLVDQERARAQDDGGQQPGAELVVDGGVQAHLPVLRRLEADLVEVREALADQCREVSRMVRPTAAGSGIVRGELVRAPDNPPTSPLALGPPPNGPAVISPTVISPTVIGPPLVGPLRGGPLRGGPADARRHRTARTGAAMGATAVLLAGALVLAGVLVGIRLGTAPAPVDALTRAAGAGAGPSAPAGDSPSPSAPSTPPTASPSISPTASPAVPPTVPPPASPADPRTAGPGSAPLVPAPAGTPTPTAGSSTPPESVVPSPSDGNRAPMKSSPSPSSISPPTAEPWTPDRLGGTPMVPPTGSVSIKNGNSLQCVATSGGTREEGQEAQQFPCGDYPDHFWESQKTFTDAEGNTYYRLVSYNSALCLTVQDSSTEADARVIQSACKNDPGQSWRIEKWPKGIRFVNGNSHQCLAVSYGSTAPRAPLMQYPCGNYPDHYWSYGPRR